ncbi:MAG: mechanosensitive ion channel, partial [Saprospiraceae bacterium]|nr:mechanosensitive ion channel [Saprospiraceae bacterium]
TAFMLKVPSLLGALLVLIVGYILAKIVGRIVRKFLERINVDRFAARLNDIDFIANSNVSIVPSRIFGKVFYYVIFLIFIIASTDVLGMAEVSTLVSQIINYIPILITAVLLLAIGIVFSDVIRKLVLTTCESLGVPSAKMISAFVFYFLLINVFIVALSQAGIDTEFIASNISIILGGAVLAFSLGYGLASKDVFSNFLTSFYSKERFKVSDTITINETTGQIIELDKSSVTLQTKEGKLILPLHKFSTEQVLIHDI